MRLWLNHVAQKADRWPNSTIAVICTALLCQLGLVIEIDQTMIIDKSKVRRKRNMFKNKLIGNFT